MSGTLGPAGVDFPGITVLHERPRHWPLIYKAVKTVMGKLGWMTGAAAVAGDCVAAMNLGQN